MIYNFEWDPKKAKTNFQKHGITFENAVTVFKDKNAISIFDEKHSSSEERWITIGIDEATRVLVVIHAYRVFDGNKYSIRIISARKATQNEIVVYKGE
jgi:uncharacterized protein